MKAAERLKKFGYLEGPMQNLISGLRAPNSRPKAEGAVAGVLGGGAGAAVGMGAVLAYASTEGWAAVIPWYASLWGIAADLASGTVSAVHPAVLSMRSNPAHPDPG
ncbi:hypothetical protein J2Y66_001805 [Paenarthrobacter nitroguajacolicus]|uniref:hypothetical protein n=1 Tax=Paenarthrobacter nitroguajacolicus TaxID=211146 RepID=UPI002864BDB0|nr:hypothetical protein [Paenarthrobacter nitroguajacolicus]MDR6987323.1 hypothetical protein [Paenarthrobacter nitroguajacolicus]